MLRPSSLPLIAIVLALVLIDLLGLFAELPGGQAMTILAQSNESPYTTTARVVEPTPSASGPDAPQSVLLGLVRKLIDAVDRGDQGTVSRLLSRQPLPLP